MKRKEHPSETWVKNSGKANPVNEQLVKTGLAFSTSLLRRGDDEAT
jgi:hypothetical protein